MMEHRAVRAWVRTSHNIHFRSGTGGGTLHSCGGAGLVALPARFRFRKTERPVQSPSRAMQPFYIDVNGSPLRFDALPLEVLDGFEVERAAVPEVQARPQSHRGSIA